MLSPPPLISMLVYISCLTLIRLSIRFSVSMRFFCSSFTIHGSHSHMHQTLNQDACKSFLFSFQCSSATSCCQCVVRWVRSTVVERLHSRILDWMRHCKRYQRVRPPFLCSIRTITLQLSVSDPVALFVMINTGEWALYIERYRSFQLRLRIFFERFMGELYRLNFEVWRASEMTFRSLWE